MKVMRSEGCARRRVARNGACRTGAYHGVQQEKEQARRLADFGTVGQVMFGGAFGAPGAQGVQGSTWMRHMDSVP